MRPLNVLLSHAVLEVTRVAERLEPGVNVVGWADFFRVADGARTKTVHLEARISRRSAKTWLQSQTKAGTISVDGSVVCLTAAGRELRDRAGEATAEACRRCETRWGRALRDALVPVVGGLELELPHYLHPYGTADPTITGGGAAGADHGADWKPIPRAPEHDPSQLSIMALLSQALVAFTIDYESRGGPLLWAVNLAAAFDTPLPLDRVPWMLAVTGTGRSTLERHGVIAVHDRTARLTPRGQRLKESYASLGPEVEMGWRARHSERAVTNLREALEHVDSSITAGHADHPVVRYTNGRFIEASYRPIDGVPR